MSSPNTDQVDVRGPRFAAWVTTGVIVAALAVSAVSGVAAAVLLGLQAVVFAIGAVGGPRAHPYGRVFATFIAPRRGPVTEREPVPPLKFAQFVGLLFAVVGTIGFAVGAPAVGLVATALALVAAFGICLGCQLYPLVTRLRRAPVSA